MKITRQARALPALMEQPFERLFERFFSTPEWPVEPAVSGTWLPALDLSETATEYVVKLDAPGFHKENLDINLDGNVVTVSGRRESQKDEETIGYIWREREEGKFVRSIRMPEAVDPVKVAATYQDGILIVRVPKVHPAAATRVPIK